MNIFGFFKEVRTELVKVVWPSRQDTFRYTATVVLFSIGVAVVLGAVDYGLLRLFEGIVTR